MKSKHNFGEILCNFPMIAILYFDANMDLTSTHEECLFFHLKQEQRFHLFVQLENRPSEKTSDLIPFLWFSQFQPCPQTFPSVKCEKWRFWFVKTCQGPEGWNSEGDSVCARTFRSTTMNLVINSDFGCDFS